MAWGNAIWGKIDGSLWQYDVPTPSTCYRGFVFDRGKVKLEQWQHGEMLQSGKNVRWTYVSSLVMWVLWNARCRAIFQNMYEAPAELVKILWIELVHSLKGYWERI